ncbi:hypothetical protein C0214_13720 [Methylobacterium sp. DM1]|nr:hypothetical protein C0214_13720 [Methylobacterium sp. DM1]
MPKPKPAATATLEAELSGLLTTRDNLRARQSTLAAELEQVVARRREVLIQGSDAAATAEAERACRDVEGTAAGIADALAEVERRIGAAEDKIADARIAGEREVAAATLERDGKLIDAAAERVRQAVAALAAAQAGLAGAITVTAAPHFGKHDFGGRRSGEAPKVVAAYLTGHMIATALPGLDVSEAMRKISSGGWTDRRLIEPTEHELPAKTLLTDPMREAAAQVRVGEASPTLPRFHRPEPDFTPEVSNVQVYVLQPFRYGTGEGRMPAIVTTVISTIPVPVAERAIAAGLASEVEPSNLASLHARRPAAITGVNVFAFHDLGFDLADWKAGEAARRRATWLAEQDREAA